MIAGDEIAQRIQLEIQYAPEPPFASGTPDQAAPSILKSSRERFSALSTKRLEAAKRAQARLRSGA
jgi:cyclohexyl-isocyanide hydratase